MTEARASFFTKQCASADFRHKAIIAMHLLRLTRRIGQKGRGASRPDHPLFRAVVLNMLNGAELLESVHNEAHAAITKYWRQLVLTETERDEAFVRDLYDTDVTPRMMLERHYDAAVRHAADEELKQALKEQETAHYGSW